MNRSLIIISMFFVAALWVPSTASAATVCDSIDAKRAYVCIEDRHSNVVVGQKEWHWSVTPNKGEFSPVPGAEDLMYTKIYTCENEDRYMAKIEVRYRFPEWIITATNVDCDTYITAGVSGGPGDPEGFGDEMDPVGDAVTAMTSGSYSFCGGDSDVAGVGIEGVNVIIYCTVPSLSSGH